MDRTLLFIITTVIAFALPLVLMIFWRNKARTNWLVFLIGALCFMLFANFLESLLHTYLLAINQNTAAFINSKPIIYALYAGLTAGVFEECGRLFGYKVLLKKFDKTKDMSVAYGIGHGGIECVLTLGVTYLLYSLALLGVSFGDDTITNSLLKTINGIDLTIVPLAVCERIFAMCLHIGLSIFVYKSTTNKKYFYFFPLAIIIHMIADIPAGLYQAGYITSLVIVEGFTCVYAIAVLLIGIKLYKGMEEE